MSKNIREKMIKRGKKIKYFFCTCIVLVLLLVLYLQKNMAITSQNNKQLDDWLGNYEFYEYFPPNINMEYNINIYHDNGNYFANIFIDGFQTSQRIIADVKGNTESIDMVFRTYLSESTGEDIEKGKILLSLKKQNSELYTYWGAVQPVLAENMNNGMVCFINEKGKYGN